MKKILVIGIADTLYGLNEIIKMDSLKVVQGLYGADCSISKAFELTTYFYESEVYIANIHKNSDLNYIMSYMRHYNFDFIVPLDINFSDTGKNLNDGTFVSMTDVLLSQIVDYSDSILIMTDKHAELYEDVDHFLKDMHDKISDYKLKSRVKNDDAKKQLIFVGNLANGVRNANMLLALILAETQIGKYPSFNIPDSVFDIHINDIKLGAELVFFQNNLNTYNSVENLVNFREDKDVYKLVVIDMVIRQINREMDLTSVQGKLLNSTTKLRIKSSAQEYLNSIKGKYIRDYAIEDIVIETNVDYTYTILCLIKILPINSLESCEILIEVK